MNYCQYHPIKPATHLCPRCEIYSCDTCTDDTHGLGQTAKCFHCSKTLDSLGASQTAMPFWRRLNESFRYPVNNEALILMIGSAVMSSATSFIPFGFIIALLISGVVLKYSFCCLQNSAQGIFQAPKISQAYQGSLLLLFQLFFLFSFVIGCMILSYFFLGSLLTILLSIILVGALPAMVINFALTDNVFSALNPASNYQLIRAIGLPYLLLLGFMMVMFSSVNIITELLSSLTPLAGSIGMNITSNYYTIVIFHIMGYMIFQYQNEIGYSARDDDDQKKPRSAYNRERARIDIQIKEGNYEKVLQLFIDLLKQHQKDRTLHTDFFNYLWAIKDADNLQKLANSYFDLLNKSQLLEQLYSEFRRCRTICPNYLPDDPSIIHTLAKRTFSSGDFKTTVNLLNGLHKKYINYKDIIEVYELLAQAFEQLPNMQKQALACKKMADNARSEKLKPKKPIPPKMRKLAKKPTPTQKKSAPIPAKSLKEKPLLTNSFGSLDTDFQAKNAITGLPPKAPNKKP